MAYSQFRNLNDVASRFDLELQTQERLFPDVPEIVPSSRLTEDLEDNLLTLSGILSSMVTDVD
jgi:hypothetical protein